jgi:signal transduction histidine kinase/CheY-like chemotaxis protein
MPETPLATDDDTGSDESLVTPRARETRRPDIVIEGSGISLSPTGNKRMRSEELDFHPGPPLKRLTTVAQSGLRRAYGISDSAFTRAITESIDTAYRDHTVDRGRWIEASAQKPDSRASSECGGSPARLPIRLDQTQGHIAIRPFLLSIVDDAIHHIHPVYKDTTQTEHGALIDVRTEGPRSQENNLTIHLVTDPDVPETIPTEEQHLQFALQKVVDNAIKFTDNGIIRITVKLARNAQLIEIRVSDTGYGLTEESKACLFKPHFQEDASISRAKDGLGLSLFNAKAHVRKNLGGDLTLERSATEGPSKGSEFLIRIPASGTSDRSRPDTPRIATPVPGSLPQSRQASPQLSTMGNIPALLPRPTSVPACAPRPRRKRPPSSLSPTLKPSSRLRSNPNLAIEVPLTFMIAEDNVINRQILVGYLKKLGYSKDDMILAFDGVEAVQQYEASLSRPPEKHIDVILMDLWMPNMDGYEATETILKMANERGESLAIMAVTADITGDSLERAKETGMKGFISKPYKVLDIEHLILQHFRKDGLSA